MSSPVYKKIALVGTSRQSIDGAVQNAVATAAKSLRHLSWFEINQVRGHIADGKIDGYQVELAIGFSLEGQEEAVHIMTALLAFSRERSGPSTAAGRRRRTTPSARAGCCATHRSKTGNPGSPARRRPRSCRY